MIQAINPGKLFVIEGGDGAGKGTQSKLALAALAEFGEVTEFDFPQYRKTLAGDIVGNALAGRYGDFRNMHPHISSLPYALDRVCARPEILNALAKGNVICNRYTPSNVMYQSAKFSDLTEQDECIAFLEKLEYDQLLLPRPDAVIYLHVPAQIARELVQQKEVREYLGTEKRAMDQHEADQAYQEAIIRLSLRTCAERDTWHMIECVEDGVLLSRDAIHERVMDVIRSVL